MGISGSKNMEVGDSRRLVGIFGSKKFFHEGEKTVVDGPVIGIDLGYCYSSVAVWHNNKIVVIPNDLGELHTPSCVAFTDNGLLVGEAAKNQTRSNPENTIYGMKRLIGRRFEEFEEDCIFIEERKKRKRYMKRLPFKVVKGQQGDIKIAVNYKGEEKIYAVQQILSLLLRKMKETAQEFLGIEVENAVITVPSMFNNLQRRATIDAGRIAGLNVVRILNESTAVALAYVHQDQHKSVEEKDVLVLDFGGSKVNSSILKIDGPHLSVKHGWGNLWLGGADLDEMMVEYLAKEFKKQSNVDISKGNPEQLWRLRKHWEKAKRSLSTTNLVTLEIDCLHGDIDFNIKISRKKFKELSRDLVDLFLKEIYLPSQTHDLVLVGGLNHIPMIRESTEKSRMWVYTKELHHVVNRDEAVAIGAAIQGAMLSGVQHIDIRNLRLRDNTRYNLYITDNAGTQSFKTAVRNLSPFPISVATSCCTTSHNQKNMTFGVYEGLSYHKLFLGDIVVKGIAPASAGKAEVELMFNIDENCILTDVTTKESQSEGELSVTFTNDPSRLSNVEIEKMMVELERWRSYDDIWKDIYFAKKELEAGLMGMTNKLEDERLKEKMEPAMFRELEVFASKLKAWIREEGNDATYQILRQKKIKLKKTQHKMSPFVAPGMCLSIFCFTVLYI